MKKVILFSFVISFFAQTSLAVIDAYTFDNPRQEAQYQALIEEFRCPKCQNQNLAGSDAPIAQDLKQKTYEMVKDGRSDGEIRNYMNERYGDFISYKPPVRPSTWVLWFLPPILLVLALLGWWLRQRYLLGRKMTLADTSTIEEHDELAPLSEAESQQLQALLNETGKTHSSANLLPKHQE